MPKASKTRCPDGRYRKTITIGRKSDGTPIKKYVYGSTLRELETKAAEYERNRTGTGGITMSTFFAVSCKMDGKNYAFVEKVTEQDNVLSSLNIPGIAHANAYGTRKRAQDVADFWNECYKKNGTSIFGASVAEAV